MKTIVVTTEEQFGVSEKQIHVFFTMVQDGVNKQTLSALVHSYEEVDDLIIEVVDFFPDEYEFEFI